MFSPAHHRAARKVSVCAGFLALVVGGVLFVPADSQSGSAAATTFSVTNGNNAGPGSLRQAFLDAAASPGADTVSVGPAVGTITVTAELVYSSADPVTVQGNGVTIRQTTAGQRVLDSTGIGKLSLLDVTVTGGRLTGGVVYGGGIYAGGPVSLTRSFVRSNSSSGSVGYGGGVASGTSSIELIDSTVESNTASGGGAAGGGVFAAYGVSLTRSTVRGNQITTGADGLGAGIWSLYGPVTLDSSTVSGNTTQGYALTYGGGIFVHAPSTEPVVRLLNSTVSGNTITGGQSRGGGIFTCRDSCATAGNVQLVYSTVAGNSSANGANVYLGSTAAKLATFASVVALPSGGGANCFRTAATTSYGYNVADDTSCQLTGAGDSQSLNPQLGALADNGGPTQTRLPAWTSPLLNRVPFASCVPPSPLPSTAADQRGTGRPQAAGGACDGGAVELSDPTPPVIAPTVSPGANAAGWHRSNVTVSWSVSDPESGIASSSGCGTTTVTSETTGLVLTCQATNRLGLSASQSVTVKLDKTTPAIAGARSPGGNAAGWNSTDVTATFTCSDGLSGIASCGPTQTLSGEGAGQSAGGQAIDVAGNTASATVSDISIDKTQPTLTGAATTSPNGNGWYAGDVTIAWSCSDTLSGLAGLCPADHVITGEGASLTAIASLADIAGNIRSSASSSVSIDRTAPLTTASALPFWTNEAVIVELTPSDNLSGVEGTHYVLDGGPQQEGTSVAVSDEGVHTIRFWSGDDAGNVELPQEAVIRIDRTPPTISHTLAPEPNPAGWNAGPVTVTFVCTDPLSGIASCTDATTITGEGASQQVPGEAEDNAGNRAWDTAFVSIDRTAPTITAGSDRVPDENGWYRADVRVAFSCSDALSGIASCPDTQTLGEGADQGASGAAIDAAGNSASANVDGIDVDETPPSIVGSASPSPNPNGWNKTDVTIHWTCADALSGLDGSCPGDTTITGEGDDLSVSAAVFDLAGNEGSSTVSGLRIDRTPPAAAVTGVIDGGYYTLGAVAAAGCATSDALSGVAADATLTVTGGTANHVGAYTATCAGALDTAGNGASASVTYEVGYSFVGFFEPVDNPPAVNIGKAGRTYPLKFRLLDANGGFVTAVSAVDSLRYKQVSCSAFSGSQTGALEAAGSGGTSLRYDTSADQFIYNWKTPKAAGCYSLFLNLDDGETYQANFHLS